jgi:CheY-like chemotaxis protein
VSAISLERLSILLVEDNLYIRDILENVLKQIGFGWVATARNGQEGIEFLQLAGKAQGQAAGLMNVDMILCDLLMSPINGLLLLRWVRMQKDSVNRFLPFIMISGAADREYVEAARDLGVTEFVAKPFSAQSISDRVMKVIDNPRQFITCTSYFGPDRRRRRMPPPGGIEDRRRPDDSHATIVYSAEKVVKPKNASDVWLFRLPNTLRDKVGGAGIKGPLELPKSLLEEAENTLQRQALDFADWAKNYLTKLSKVTEAAMMSPNNRRNHFQEMNLVAHELRGQGGTFGYPLITVFAKSLYDATLPGCPEDDSALSVVKAHTDAMRAVIRDRISGDGGEIGRELLKSLKVAIDRAANRTI